MHGIDDTYVVSVCMCVFVWKLAKQTNQRNKC